jgi:hypothetical protein
MACSAPTPACMGFLPDDSGRCYECRGWVSEHGADPAGWPTSIRQAIKRLKREGAWKLGVGRRLSEVLAHLEAKP